MPKLTLDALFGGATAGAVFALLLWWLIRKRHERVWLPTIRVMEFESRRLPRMRVVTPPMLAFLCFSVAAAAFLGFASRMRETKPSPSEPRQARVHVFVDMSPSVAASGSIFDLGKQMTDLWTSLRQTSRLTLSTSHAPSVFEPSTPEEAGQLVQSLGFHRAGVRLGTALKTQLEKIGQVDRLIVLSDRDQHSWSGFNWSFLLEDMDVNFLEAGGASQAAGTNIFFNSAQFLSTPTQPTMDWDVELTRRSGGASDGEIEGTLKATFRGTQLASTPVKFAADRKSLMVRISWPATQATGLASTALADEPLIWQLEIAGGDAVAADNEYRTALLGLKKDILLVGEPSGEQVLDDPATSLQIALNVLGFQVRRVDTLTQPGPRPESFPLWILFGGGAKGIDSWCPRAIETARIDQKWQQGAQGFTAQIPRVWLVPYSLDANFQSLCTCYHRLLLSDSKTSVPPAYCSELNSRNAWAELLPGIGAKQIGGEIGKSTSAMAWRGQHQGSGLDVLAFTVPLRPMVATGISHAALPLLVKDLLVWQKMLLPAGVQSGASWPRIADLAEVQLEGNRMDSVGLGPKLILSNVPVGESLMNQESLKSLPPQWGMATAGIDREGGSRRDQDDPLPWLRLLAMVVVAATALEGLWLLLRFAGQLWTNKRKAMVVPLILLIQSGIWTEAKGQVQITTVRTENPAILFTALARDVSQRTSIEMAPRPVVSAAVDETTLEQPWIWVSGLEDVVARGSEEIRPDIAFWIKRGGFLIVDRAPGIDQLGKLTEKIFSRENFKGVWQPIPPDHEVMRSFYLLDALPLCQNMVWQGFQFDGRLAILAAPYKFLDSLGENAPPSGCANAPDRERSVRVFVNLMMVALATDYKKDQIHLPEILKRLR